MGKNDFTSFILHRLPLMIKSSMRREDFKSNLSSMTMGELSREERPITDISWYYHDWLQVFQPTINILGVHYNIQKHLTWYFRIKAGPTMEIITKLGFSTFTENLIRKYDISAILQSHNYECHRDVKPVVIILKIISMVEIKYNT